MSQAHQRYVRLALAALGLGMAVYLLDRPAVPEPIPSALSVSALTPTVFGALGASLPTFVHVLAFSLLTAALLAGGKRTALIVCLGWLVLETVFEVGQHPTVAPTVATVIPAWFAHVPILNPTDEFFLAGTFDPFDLLAIALGAAVAYLVIAHTERGRVGHAY